MIRAVVGLVLGMLLSLSLPGCGGTYKVDAAEAVAQLREERLAFEAKIEQLAADLRVAVDAREADQVVQRLIDEIRRVEERSRELEERLRDAIDELEAEARGDGPDRPAAPATPASAAAP